MEGNNAAHMKGLNNQKKLQIQRNRSCQLVPPYARILHINYLKIFG